MIAEVWVVQPGPNPPATEVEVNVSNDLLRRGVVVPWHRGKGVRMWKHGE